MNWDTLIDETALARLLPAEYAHFARPVKEGLVEFLRSLPLPAQEHILTDQAAFPFDATLSVRRAQLARSCPVLHKLGQVLARDGRLAPELRHELRQLESLPPTVNLDTIRAILADELGPLDELGVTLLPPAIAEASVAVVIPYRDDRDPTAPEGVFKILKPGIEQRMVLELNLLAQVGSHLDSRCEELSIPHLDYRETFDQVRSKLSVEVRLDLEQQHLAEAKAIYAEQPDVQIPALFAHCTPRVTAMERVFGDKITDQPLEANRDKHRLAKLVTRALLAESLFSPAHRAMFHSDPHAGNLLYTCDGRLAILDWSLVGHLGEAERVAIGQIVLAAIMLRPERIVALLTQLDERRSVDLAALGQIVERSLGRIRHGQLPGLTWLVALFDDATQSARLRVAPDLLLFRKSLLTLEGVINELGADGFTIEQALIVEFVCHFGREWPARWYAAPGSRLFPTRLSNADLVHTCLSATRRGEILASGVEGVDSRTAILNIARAHHAARIVLLKHKRATLRHMRAAYAQHRMSTSRLFA